MMGDFNIIATVDGEYMRSIVCAYNHALRYVQFGPVLEVYEKDGDLYACDCHLPKTNPFEFKLWAEVRPHEIKVVN